MPSFASALLLTLVFSIQPAMAFEFCDRNALPAPWDRLLTAPLLTPGLARFYERSPRIERLLEVHSTSTGLLARAIRMVVDVKGRPNEKRIIETALIVINLSALPAGVREGVLQTDLPFGALLERERVQVQSKGRQYFKLSCSPLFVWLLDCSPDAVFYGRTHLLVDAATRTWLARVMEVVPVKTAQ